jgi:hypothetical protein
VSVAPGGPSYLVNYTPVPGYCPQNIVLTYRVVHRDAIRWIDGTLGTRTTVSNQFQARAVANTQVFELLAASGTNRACTASWASCPSAASRPLAHGVAWHGSTRLGAERGGSCGLG